MNVAVKYKLYCNNMKATRITTFITSMDDNYDSMAEPNLKTEKPKKYNITKNSNDSYPANTSFHTNFNDVIDHGTTGSITIANNKNDSYINRNSSSSNGNNTLTLTIQHQNSTTTAEIKSNGPQASNNETNSIASSAQVSDNGTTVSHNVFNFDLFHVRHPITGKYVISRYGTNCTNRRERFPSITQRIMLYMSNWYLPACDSMDISAARYYTGTSSDVSANRRILQTTTTEKGLVEKRTGEQTNAKDLVKNHQYQLRGNNEFISSNSIGNKDMPSLPIHYITVSSYNQTFGKMDLSNIPKSEIGKYFMKGDFNNIVQVDAEFYLTENNIMLAAANTNNQILSTYSFDVNNSIITTMKRLRWFNQSNSSIPPPPVLIQYGDRTHSTFHPELFDTIQNIPVIKKFRTAIISDEQRTQIALHGQQVKPTIGVSTSSNSDVTTSILECTSSIRPLTKNARTETLQPIIWKLNTERHYLEISTGLLDAVDIVPYEDKYNVAIFRGAMSYPGLEEYWDDYYSQQVEEFVNMSDFELCARIPRCRFVMMYSNDTSPNIDAKITKFELDPDLHPWSITVPLNYNYQNKFPIPSSLSTTNGTLSSVPTRMVDLRGNILDLESLLKYKMLIFLEGNDVSSGLKWGLYSSSVVIMPYPVTVTSWAMEELLEPYVHFVPIQQDLTDLHDAVQWILSHEKEAKYISSRATQWINDLLNYPEEDQLIQDEILDRYRSNFFYFQNE
jgi:Glycosyl transferase family 90